MKKVSFGITILIICYSLIVFPSQNKLLSDKPLEGTYYIGGLIVDGALSQGTSHMYFNISGLSAKELYNRIPTQPKKNICIDDGSMVKFTKDGNIQCTESRGKNTYKCNFSIDIQNARLDLGGVC